MISERRQLSTGPVPPLSLRARPNLRKPHPLAVLPFLWRPCQKSHLSPPFLWVQFPGGHIDLFPSPPQASTSSLSPESGRLSRTTSPHTLSFSLFYISDGIDAPLSSPTLHLLMSPRTPYAIPGPAGASHPPTPRSTPHSTAPLSTPRPVASPDFSHYTTSSWSTAVASLPGPLVSSSAPAPSHATRPSPSPSSSA